MASKIGMAMSGANGSGTQGNGDAGHSEGEDKEKGDEPHSNGGGIVKQIMSNLPTSGTSLPVCSCTISFVFASIWFQLTGFVLSVLAFTADTPGPNAEEASMLISFIED